MAKTRDGIQLENIIDVAIALGATVRGGTNHSYALNYKGLRPCPVASSTDAEKMVIPWLKQIAGIAGTANPGKACNKNQLYSALKQGYLPCEIISY